ncbi:MAG: hypothetical protein A2622_13315 [Bdellovibrionales bacterium RIFCSPHIGHO2_01_FULL_40_29]|nr:MAG: hypothetical protein A2622_13315 [Bdellovibrionales bacterium RIFCSPHIGHO2_01_FULL_40_29]OFZ33333.1 MAG: hypothetical protein A3D17_13570 [Bdellovibrionales bacterium RIFCSPHIGHO2_02_FULL_40_15]
MSRCEIAVNGNEVSISGIIDDTFGVVAAQLPLTGKLKVNLKNLKSINSTGIREWIKQMQRMKTAFIEFYECPKVFIDQVNMVQGFVPANGKVESFYVPFFNEENETEKNVLFKYGEHYTEGKLNPLPEIKDDTGAVMELDVVEAKYFKFIKG